MEETMQFLRSVFNVLDNRTFFRWITISLFGISAIGILLFSMVIDFNLMQQVADSRFAYGLALIVFGLSALAACASSAFVLVYRGAYEIYNSKSEAYSLIPLFSRVIRTCSEAYLVFAMVASPGACLSIWIGGAQFVSEIPVLGVDLGGAAFVVGILTALYGLFSGIAQLCLSYLFAEVIELLASVANDVRALRYDRVHSTAA